MATLLGIIHGIDYALTSWLVGFVIFYFLIVGAGGLTAKNLLSDFPKRVRNLSFLTFVSSAIWMVLSAHDMAESWSLTELWRAMAMTSFGHLWCARIIVLLALVLFSTILLRRVVGAIVCGLLVCVLPLLSVLSGHAGSQTNDLFLRVSTDYLHAMCVGIWGGGLWMLYVWLGKRLSEARFDQTLSLKVVNRFSHFAMASTFLISLTGVLTAWLNGVPLLTPWTSLYGQLIMVKILFFGAALLAAAVNQFIHLKHWRTENELVSVKAMRREVRLEFILILFVFATVGFLARTGLPGEGS